MTNGHDEFSAPAASTGLDYDAMKGHLLVVEPLLYEPEIKTTLGTKDAIRANVVDVTTESAYPDVLIFPRVLVNSLRGRMGAKVLGVLSQGEAKPGQNPPWLIADATGDPKSREAASAVLKRLSSGQFSAPAAAAATPAATPTPAQAQATLQSVFGGTPVEPPF
jgi:hypothetical protein